MSADIETRVATFPPVTAVVPTHRRPELMRQEWGNDQGLGFALRHRAEVIDEIRKARAALDEFKPDFIVVWGDDQYENFKEDVIPAFCVLAYWAFR